MGEFTDALFSIFFIETLINGLLLGGVLALLSLGLNLIFGVIDVVWICYAEIIMPTVNGCLNIMRRAARHGVRNVVICSSTSSTNPIPPVPIKNEVDHWSDEREQCRAKKYTSATKTVMEKAAIRFADENDMRLSIILPTGMKIQK